MPEPWVPRRRAPPAARPGFTLAESVLALALLGSGALVVVVASATAVRSVAEGEAQVSAVVAARNRVELLAAGGCRTLRDGTAFDSATAVRESWRISGGRSAARLIT